VPYITAGAAYRQPNAAAAPVGLQQPVEEYIRLGSRFWNIVQHLAGIYFCLDSRHNPPTIVATKGSRIRAMTDYNIDIDGLMRLSMR
jgi:hypothetical protein